MLTKGIVYIADHDLPADITEACQQQLLRAANGIYIVSVSLKPIDFGDNICLGLVPGPVTVFKQVLAGVSNVQEDITFICLPHLRYNSSHLEFSPLRDDLFYYNQNTGGLPVTIGHLCARTRLLIDHYGDRLLRIECSGFRPGLDGLPGATPIRYGGIDDHQAATWASRDPVVEILT